MIIQESGEMAVGMELVITNIVPNEDIMLPEDPLYEEKWVREL